MSSTALAPPRLAGSRPAPDRTGAPAPRDPRPSGRPHPAVAAGLVVVVALTASLATVRAGEASADRAAEGRTGRASGTDQVDAVWLADQPAALAVVAGTTQRAALLASARSAEAEARAVVSASPHAGDLLAALTAAADRLRDAAAAPGPSPIMLRARLTDLAAARGAVVQAEAAWQTAEAARLAAEQAAAEQAAAQQAAARQTSGASRSGHRASTGSSAAGSSSAGSSADASAGTVHAVSMACVTPAPGSGSPASASSVGAAINDYRAAQGLPALSVSTSGTLSSHALDMAASGGIWHSGADNIVGCAPGAGSLVRAWSGSPAHNAQMLRTDVSSMSIGAASASGYLFAAVAFR